MGNGVLEKSRTAGRLCQLLTPGLEDIVEGDDQISVERLQGILQEFDKSLEWVWKESAEVDRERALSMLRDLKKVSTTLLSNDRLLLTIFFH